MATARRRINHCQLLLADDQPAAGAEFAGNLVQILTAQPDTAFGWRTVTPPMYIVFIMVYSFK